jgi:hypothetical protein
VGCGDGADGQGGHDEHEVAADRGVEPGLALVRAGVILSEVEFSSAGRRSRAARMSRALVNGSYRLVDNIESFHDQLEMLSRTMLRWW